METQFLPKTRLLQEPGHWAPLVSLQWGVILGPGTFPIPGGDHTLHTPQPRACAWAITVCESEYHFHLLPQGGCVRPSRCLGKEAGRRLGRRLRPTVRDRPSSEGVRCARVSDPLRHHHTWKTVSLTSRTHVVEQIYIVVK